MATQYLAPEHVKSNPSTAAAATPSRHEQQAAALMVRGQYDQAALVLAKCGPAKHLLNVRGVCLLRAGEAAEAILLYRTLVLQPGCTWTRLNLPLAYKRNFATALLMGGLPSGCLDILEELGIANDASVQHLHRAIRNWEKSLGFWSRWNWRINRIEPKVCHVPIDFVPGEFAPGDLWFDFPNSATMQATQLTSASCAVGPESCAVSSESCAVGSEAKACG